MWTCARCGEKSDASIVTCPNCGAGPERAPAGKLIKVWSTTSHTDAELLRVALRREGVESILENVGGAQLAIGLGTSTIPFVITVAEVDAPKAMEILRAEAQKPKGGEFPDRYHPPAVMISFECSCGRVLEVPPDFDGLEMDCPFCNKTVTARKSP